MSALTNFQSCVFTTQFSPAVAGFTLNPITGALTFGTMPSGARLRNFVVCARVVLTDSKILEKKIRIHVHDDIERLWLTPGSLSAPPASSSRRFSVLAEFDDGVVGDITWWPSLKWQSYHNAVTVLTVR